MGEIVWGMRELEKNFRPGLSQEELRHSGWEISALAEPCDLRLCAAFIIPNRWVYETIRSSVG